MAPPGSLPSRERGLKLPWSLLSRVCPYVAPFTGAWIEILKERYGDKNVTVAPFTGAWIEIEY